MKPEDRVQSCQGMVEMIRIPFAGSALGPLVPRRGWDCRKACRIHRFAWLVRLRLPRGGLQYRRIPGLLVLSISLASHLPRVVRRWESVQVFRVWVAYPVVASASIRERVRTGSLEVQVQQ